MGDSCCNPLSMGSMEALVKKYVPGIYINSVRVGDNTIQDVENSYFMNVNSQIEYVCQLVKNDSKLAGGYHAMGFSQGGLFMRGLAQRCPDPPIRNLISIGGPQQGVFGLPHCPGANYTICEFIAKMLNIGAYNTYVQDHLVQAEYWHDPLNEHEYKHKSVFLADINNEQGKVSNYNENMAQLENMVLVMFNQDTMVIPKQSEWFGFFTEGQSTDITYLRNSTLYTQDRIGLKELDTTGRLHLLATDGDHLQIDETWFAQNIILPYVLTNTTAAL